jgi:hypothetical protein
VPSKGFRASPGVAGNYLTLVFRVGIFPPPGSGTSPGAGREDTTQPMRMMMPGVRSRRRVDGLLTRFFHQYDRPAFQRAVAAMAGFYELGVPRVVWFEYLDWGKTGGRTYENGRIHLVHPENWKRGRKYNSERQWVHTVYHEMGHYVLWADAERKADQFAYRFVRNVSANGNASARRYYAGATSLARRKRGRTRSRRAAG